MISAFKLFAVLAGFLESCRNDDAARNANARRFRNRPGTVPAGVVITTRSGTSGRSRDTGIGADAKKLERLVLTG